MSAWKGHDWQVTVTGGALRFTPVDESVGRLKTADGAWLPLAKVTSVEGWIDGTMSGVKAHLAGETAADILVEDSGNVDPTATWNEYLYDGAWAFGAGRELAGWIGVPYRDAWSA